jgi:hypothetical protein
MMDMGGNEMTPLKNVTLEMSLKPFRSLDEGDMERVCRQVFQQWYPLIKHAHMVSVLLWSSDGTEILEYKGCLDDTFDWARYIGGVNPRKEWDRQLDPQGVGLHTRSYLYMENPPVFIYGILKDIVAMIRKIGEEMTGKRVRVGATFDPGPEFAWSDFKYKRHEEICLANTYGARSFVCCYGVLHQDEEEYAGFPHGIPGGTPFGTFFGRQCSHFLKDMDFDFIWFSNGFGFGCENWGVTGALFDGKEFDSSKVEEVKVKILEFWKLFRKECPDIPVETRGTNLTTGVDLSTDGVPLQDIYRGDFQIMPPPNSPWAALNRDFGLELAGYMSRIVELPGEDYMFRFYVHDPWWMNSPWLDRYEGLPYDIYLPLAVSRITEDGRVQSPSYINFLTIDNSMGEMPDKCPNEIIPHILNAYDHLPDRVSPFVWIYPFDEYHGMVAAGKGQQVFFEDWFMRGAINHGLPLSTVVSTRNFMDTRKVKPELYRGSILIAPVPLKNSEFEKVLMDEIRSGAQVLLYGPLEDAGEDLLRLLNLSIDSCVDGILDMVLKLKLDEVADGKTGPDRINHRSLLSGGGIGTVLQKEDDPWSKILMKVSQEGKNRVAAISREDPRWQGGKLVWIRGTNSCYYQEGEMLLLPDSQEEYFHTERLMRLALEEFGYVFRFEAKGLAYKSPVIMLHRNNGAFYASGYMPDTTVALKMRFPMGAPLFTGGETELLDGCSLYRMPRSWHLECRVFTVDSESRVLSCTEYPPVSHVMKRRIQVSGLKNTTLRIFPERGLEEETQLLLNSFPEDHLTGDPMEYELMDSPWGKYLEVRHVTGRLMISTPFRKKAPF